MLRLLSFLGGIVALGLALLTGPEWAPRLLGDTSTMMRAGAVLALSGGAALLLLSRASGASTRIVLLAVLVLGATAWAVPLLLHRVSRAVTAQNELAGPAPTVEDVPLKNGGEGREAGADGLRGEVRVQPDESGHFFVRGRVNGHWINFLVDTGATRVALSEADARRLGFQPRPTQFTLPVRTASGTAMTAPATLETVEIGPIRVRQVSALIASSGLGVSLLGMSFLSQLSGYSVEDGVLYLRE